MLCPECMTQCHQKDREGGGTSETDYYETWTIQICPQCGAEFKEYYKVHKIKEGK